MTQPLSYRPAQSAVHYTPPRPFALSRLLISALCSALAIVVGSILYAKIEPQLLDLYLRVAGCVCAGVALGMLTLIPIRVGRVQIPAMASVVGSLLGILAIYVIWLVWLHDTLHLNGLSISIHALVVRPVVAFRLTRIVDQVGTWSYRGEVQRGIPLLICWLGEGAIILAGAVAFPILGLYSGDPHCLECGAKCKRASNLPRFTVERQNDFFAAIESREFQSLASHPAAKHQDHPELSLRLMSCPKCGKMQVLTVNRIEWVRNPQGRRVVNFTPLIDQILITPEESEAIKAVCVQIRQQRQAAIDLAENSPPEQMPTP